MTRIVSVLFLLFILTSCGGNAENIDTSSLATDFTLQDAYGKSYTLSDYKDKSPVVVYFYPKANTSGCTTQACGIRDVYSKFKENNIVVFGISVDQKEDLKEFIKDHNLNFPLLSDADKKVSKAYGVLNDFGLSNRITFIIDKNGKIAELMRDVDVSTHADQIYEKASKLL